MKTTNFYPGVPLGTQRRHGTNADWPIRRADGRTPAEVRPHYRPKEVV